MEQINWRACDKLLTEPDRHKYRPAIVVSVILAKGESLHKTTTSRVVTALNMKTDAYNECTINESHAIHHLLPRRI